MAARAASSAGSFCAQCVEDPGHGRLHVGVEGGVLHLVDLIERDERPDRLSASFWLAEELAQELKQAADGVVVALARGSSGCAGRW